MGPKPYVREELMGFRLCHDGTVRAGRRSGLCVDHVSSLRYRTSSLNALPLSVQRMCSSLSRLAARRRAGLPTSLGTQTHRVVRLVLRPFAAQSIGIHLSATVYRHACSPTGRLGTCWPYLRDHPMAHASPRATGSPRLGLPAKWPRLCCAACAAGYGSQLDAPLFIAPFPDGQRLPICRQCDLKTSHGGSGEEDDLLSLMSWGSASSQWPSALQMVIEWKATRRQRALLRHSMVRLG